MFVCLFVIWLISVYAIIVLKCRFSAVLYGAIVEQ